MGELIQPEFTGLASSSEATSAEPNLQVIRHHLGTVSLTGHCFANDDVKNRAANEAIANNNLEALCDLPGSYSSFVQTTEHTQIIADRTGQFPVYYNPSSKVAATTMDAVTDGPRLPNALYMATYSILSGMEEVLLEDQSSVRGINKLRPGYSLGIDKSGIDSKPVDIIKPDRHITLEESVDKLRFALQESIRHRLELNSKLSVDLSGGKDSSSLAFLAANTAQKEIPAFMSYHPGIETGDLSYAQQFADMSPFLNLSTIAYANEHPIYDSSATMPHSEDLCNEGSLRFWGYVSNYYKHVDEAGGQIHLTGRAGDEVLSAHPSYLVDVLRAGHIGRFWKEGLALARIHKISPLEVWRNGAAMLTATPRRALLDIAKSLDNPHKADSLFNPFQNMSVTTQELQWLTEDMRKQLADLAYEKSSTFELGDDHGWADYVAWNGVMAAGSDAQAAREYIRQAGFNFDLHAPFLDRHVVDACLSLPSYRRFNPNEFKFLLNKAMAGLIPEEVLVRRSKGDYSGVSFEVYYKSLPQLKALFKNSRLADLGVINPDEVVKSLDEFALNPKFPIWSLGRMVRAETWLRGFDNLPASSPKPNLRPRIELTNKNKTQRVDLQSPLFLAKHVYAVSSQDGRLVLFNPKTDKYHPFDATASNMLKILMSTGSVDRSLQAMLKKYPNTDPNLISNDFDALISQLIDYNVLGSGAKGTTPDNRDFSTASNVTKPDGEHLEALSGDAPEAPFLTKMLAVVALGVGATLSKHAPGVRIPLMNFMQKWTTKDASQQDAEKLLNAVHAVSAKWAGRIACLEESYAAALMGAITNRKVEWHVGVRFDPLGFHSWIEADDKPVHTQFTDRAESYQSFFK